MIVQKQKYDQIYGPFHEMQLMPRTARVAIMQIVIGLNNKIPRSDIEFNAEDQV